MSHNIFITGTACLSLLFSSAFFNGYGQNQSRTDLEIAAEIERHRPSLGAAIPADIKHRLGATHVDGKYHLTNQPYIIEGARKLDSLGYGILKLWFDAARENAKGYIYNSQWDLPADITPRQMAEHPYYKACFDMPFSTIVLCHNKRFPGNTTKDLSESFRATENEMYDLARYLLKTYRKRDLTFIIQNWEGDWLLRGGTGPQAQWKKNGPSADYPTRVKNMRGWIEARQKGIARARAEVKRSKCKVLLAVEANKVMDAMAGIPSVASHILPEVEVDMVSWSAYDGVSGNGLKMYKGIDYLRSQLRPTPYMNGKKTVMIGEIGYPENMGNRTKEKVQKMWDTFMAVYLAQDIPYILVWELYCNERKKDEFDRRPYPLETADNLRGFWLIRPDGSESWAQEYLGALLKNAGKKIKATGNSPKCK